MPTIIAHRRPDPAKAARLAPAGELDELLIEAVDCGEFFFALEGADELPAAVARGLVPQIISHKPADRLLPGAYDWYDTEAWDAIDWPGSGIGQDDEAPPPRAFYTGEDIVFALNGAEAVRYEFPDIAVIV